MGACPPRRRCSIFCHGPVGIFQRFHILPLDPAGDFRSPDPSGLPPPLVNSLLRPCEWKPNMKRASNEATSEQKL